MKKFLKYNIFTQFFYLSYLRLSNRNVEHYVFVATTGRSGSNTLCDIFDGVESIRNLHEPYPVMFSDLSDFTDGELSNLSADKRKLINIYRQARGKRLYIETSHLFIKNFLGVVMDNLPKHKIRIIHLKRDPISVAKSFYLIGSIPGKTERGKKYLLDPIQENNCIRLPELYSDDVFSHDFYKCLWYWFEIEARFERLKTTLPISAWCDFDTTDLNDKEKVSALAEFLGIENRDKMHVVDKTGLRKNKKNSEKDQESLMFDEMYESFVNLLKIRGYSELAAFKYPI